MCMVYNLLLCLSFHKIIMDYDIVGNGSTELHRSAWCQRAAGAEMVEQYRIPILDSLRLVAQTTSQGLGAAVHGL